MIRTLHEGLFADGFAVPLTKLCAWFDVPRRTVYYKPVKSPPKIDPAFEDPIKAMIEERKDVWYSDEGSLTYTLCEDDSPLAEPPVSQEIKHCYFDCCFHSLFTRATVPAAPATRPSTK